MYGMWKCTLEILNWLMAKRTKFFGFSLDKFIFYVTRPVFKTFLFYSFILLDLYSVLSNFITFKAKYVYITTAKYKLINKNKNNIFSSFCHSFVWWCALNVLVLILESSDIFSMDRIEIFLFVCYCCWCWWWCYFFVGSLGIIWCECVRAYRTIAFVLLVD